MAAGTGAFISSLLLVFPIMSVRLPAVAAPPFVTDDPQPVEYGHWEVFGFATGTMARDESVGSLPGVEIQYGALPDMRVSVTIPFEYNSQSVTGTVFGLGDVGLSVKYRFIDPGKDDPWPQVAFAPAVYAPTGSAALGLGSGAFHEFLPLWMQKDFGKWTTYGGGGYWINPGPGNKNYWFVGWELQRQITEKLMLGGELFHQTAFTTGTPGSAGFPLGSKATTGFNLGGQYDLTEHYHLLFSAGTAIQNRTATDQFSYYVGLQWTF
jgi:hypothetical protein